MRTKLFENFNFDIFFKSLFYIGHVLYVFGIFISESTLFNISYVYLATRLVIHLSLLIIFLVFAYNFFTKKYKFYEYILFFFIFAILFISYNFSKRSLLLVVWAYVYAAKGIDFEKDIKYVLISSVITYSIIVLARVFGISEELVFYATRHGKDCLRYSFGFNYTCIGSFYLLYMSIMYVYVKKEKISLVELSVVLAFNIIAYILTATVSNLFFAILLVALSIFVKYNKIKLFNIIYYKISLLLSTFSVLLIVSLTYLYMVGNRFALIVNNFVRGRLSLASDAILKYGIKLFGQNIILYGGGEYYYSDLYNYVDSAFMQHLLIDGIVLTILIIVFLTCIMLYSYKKNNIWLSICFTVIILKAVFDDRLMHPYLVPFLVVFLESTYVMVKNNNYDF